MSQPWIKVWQEKILSSMNLRDCNFTEHGLFLELLIRVRPDGQHLGKLCYPNGQPIPDKKLYTDMKLRPSLYFKAKDALIAKNVLAIDNGVMMLRKFEELQSPSPNKHTTDTTPAQVQHNASDKPLKNNGLDTPTEQNRTEEKITEKEKKLPSSVIPNEKPKEISPLAYNEQISLQLALKHHETCQAQPVEWAKKEFWTVLNAGVKAKDIESAIAKYPGRTGKEIAQMLKDEMDLIPCKPCEGSGTMAFGEPCAPCKGTGKVKRKLKNVTAV